MPAGFVSTFASPVIVALIALLAAAAFYDFILFRRRPAAREAVYRCDSCRHIYTESHRTPLARCPKCGQQNEPVRE
jgi:rRNA maturation endonuclease Nob1